MPDASASNATPPAAAASTPTATVPAVNTSVDAATHITPLGTNHNWFGRVLKVIKKDAVYVWGVIESEAEKIEVRFNKTDVKSVKADGSALVSATPAAAAPVATTPPPAK